MGARGIVFGHFCLLRRDERAKYSATASAMLTSEIWTRPAPAGGSAHRSSSSSSCSSTSSSEKAKPDLRPITDEELPCLRLCEAATRGDSDECTRLLDSGTVKDINWRRPEDGNTAMHLAAEESHVNVVSVLLTRGADVEITNDFLLTPFALATPGGVTEKLLGEVTKPLDE